MGERNLLLIDGPPGSGKSSLGGRVARELRTLKYPHPTEHISVGDLVRAVASGAVPADEELQRVISAHLSNNQLVRDKAQEHLVPGYLTPLKDDVIYRLLEQHLKTFSDIDTIILDGYPRYESQVDGFQQLLGRRAFLGMILTEINDENALTRQLKRHPRSNDHTLNRGQAEWRVDEYRQHAPEVQHRLGEYYIAKSALDFMVMPTELIETSTSKEETTAHGLKFARGVLRLDPEGRFIPSGIHEMQ